MTDGATNWWIGGPAGVGGGDYLGGAVGSWDLGDSEHVYLSTECLHSRHDECRLGCEHCPAQCVCVHHRKPLDEK